MDQSLRRGIEDRSAIAHGGSIPSEMKGFAAGAPSRPRTSSSQICHTRSTLTPRRPQGMLSSPALRATFSCCFLLLSLLTFDLQSEVTEFHDQKSRPCRDFRLLISYCQATREYSCSRFPFSPF